MTIAQVRAAIATAIDGMSNIRCSPYLCPVNPPCAMVRREEIDPRMVLGGQKCERQFTVLVYHGRSDDRSAQVALDVLADLPSIKTTLESDSALNALVEAGEVVRIGGEQLVTVSGVEYVGFEIELRVVF